MNHPSPEELDAFKEGRLELSSNEAIAETSSTHRTPSSENHQDEGPSTVDYPAGRFLGPYRIRRVLKEGGMGRIYAVSHPTLPMELALKTIRPDLAALPGFKPKFLREAEILARLAGTNPDHIVPIHTVGEDDGILYIVMPLLVGETLEERLVRDKRLASSEVIRLAREIVLALAFAHDQGILHRDLKPSNVFLENRPEPNQAPRAKLLDFGLARSLGPGEDGSRNGFAGTPGYMAPEQVACTEADIRTDLFGLGCVLYRMTTGTLPFPHRFEPGRKNSLPTSAWMAALVDENHRPCSPQEFTEVPDWFSELLLRLLEKKPADRPDSAWEVWRTIEASGQSGTNDFSKPLSRSKGSGGKRIPMRSWGIAATTLAAFFLGWSAFLVEKEKENPAIPMEKTGPSSSEEDPILGKTKEDSAPRVISVDIIFLLDTTGSMASAIRALSDGIASLAEELKKEGFPPRFGLVEFKDLVHDGAEGLNAVRFEKEAFTSDPGALKKSLRNINAGGGGDLPESIFDAIVAATHYPFRRDALRILVLITDAPPRDAPATLDDALDALEKNQIHQVHVNCLQSDRRHYDILQKMRKGSFIDLGKTEGDSIRQLAAAIKSHSRNR